MNRTLSFAAKAGLVAALSVMALTACTNASQTEGIPSGQTSAGPSFDPASVTKNDTLAAQVPEAIKSKGTLVVGSDTTYAPAEFLGPDARTPMGYDVDLAKAIGAKLGLKVEVQTAEFTGILPALGAKYDLGISSFIINNRRLSAANFVSYFDAGTTWAVQKGNPKKFSLDEVCGKTVGVQTGTVQEDPDLKGRSDKCVKDGKPAINVVTLKGQTDITTRLTGGTIDAMLAASPIVAYAEQQTNGAIEKTGETYGKTTQGIAVAKDDKALADVVQKVMTELISDGSYQKILQSWNNADGALAKSEVNPAVTS